MNGNAQLEFLPEAVGGIHGCIESDRKCQAGSVSQGEAEGASLLNEGACDPGMLGSKRFDVGNRVYGKRPGFLRVSAFPDEDGLHFGQVYRAGGCAAQEFRREFPGPRLIVEQGEDGGGVEHHFIQAGLPGVFPQSVHPRASVPV
jgi:hypothetical protein